MKASICHHFSTFLAIWLQIPACSGLFAWESGKNILSLFTLGNTIDKSNSRIDPTEGWYFSNSLGLAGFGGDKKYIKINDSSELIVVVNEIATILNINNRSIYIYYNYILS